MKSKTVYVCLATVLLFVIGVGGTAYSQESMTVTGVLTDEFTIATDDGEEYDVAEDENSIQMFEMTGGRVKATGDLMDSEDGPMFKVRSYMYIDE